MNAASFESAKTSHRGLLKVALLLFIVSFGTILVEQLARSEIQTRGARESAAIYFAL
jgi:hypothetical protein